jgi:hypothetical protein
MRSVSVLACGVMVHLIVVQSKIVDFGFLIRYMAVEPVLQGLPSIVLY